MGDKRNNLGGSSAAVDCNPKGKKLGIWNLDWPIYSDKHRYREILRSISIYVVCIRRALNSFLRNIGHESLSHRKLEEECCPLALDAVEPEPSSLTLDNTLGHVQAKTIAFGGKILSSSSVIYSVTVLTMRSQLLRIFFGALLGLSLSLLIYVILFEHLTLFLMLPVFPIIGTGIGILLGSIKKLPPMKIYLSLAIFTAIFAISIGCIKLKDEFLRRQRESIAASIAQIFPGADIVKITYEKGNGWEIPPNVDVHISKKTTRDEVSHFYAAYFEKNGQAPWQDMSADGRGRKWQNKNIAVYLNYNNYKDKGPEDYKIGVDFYGSWIAQVLAFQSFHKELLPL